MQTHCVGSGAFDRWAGSVRADLLELIISQAARGGDRTTKLKKESMHSRTSLALLLL
jgi:hypothetical protein